MEEKKDFIDFTYEPRSPIWSPNSPPIHQNVSCTNNNPENDIQSRLQKIQSLLEDNHSNPQEQSRNPPVIYYPYPTTNLPPSNGISSYQSTSYYQNSSAYQTSSYPTTYYQSYPQPTYIDQIPASQQYTTDTYQPYSNSPSLYPPIYYPPIPPNTQQYPSNENIQKTDNDNDHRNKNKHITANYECKHCQRTWTSTHPLANKNPSKCNTCHIKTWSKESENKNKEQQNSSTSTRRNTYKNKIYNGWSDVSNATQRSRIKDSC